MSSPFAARPTAVVLDAGARMPATASVPRPVESPAVQLPESAGYVVVDIGGTAYAVPVEQVGSVLRHGSEQVVGRGPDGAVLVDVRGRTVPAVDRRSDPSRAGDVLVPHWRRHAGLVVDRVVSVVAADELVAEGDGAAHLASATAVLRPTGGGGPVLLVDLPTCS